MSRTGNLIGFKPEDRRHYDAVSEGNKRKGRRLDVRWLASVCILGGGDLGSKASAAIIKFADDLPFDYAEERENSETVQRLKRTAEIWAEVGRSTNYRVTPAEDGSGVVIQLDNPKAQGPDIDAINQRHAEMAKHFLLLNWAHDCFGKNALGDGLILEQAIERARLLDTSSLFEEAYEHVSPDHQRQGAVASVAAVALCLGQDLPLPDVGWAADVCLRAWKTPEAADSHFFSGSVLFHHPVLYASRGLAALGRRESTQQNALEALLHLAAHPYEQIVTEALGGLLSLWDKRPDIAWLALGLAVSLSIFERPPHAATSEQCKERKQRHIETAVEAALDQLEDLPEPSLPLPSMPPAWVPAPEGRGVRRRRRKEEVIEWEHPVADLNWHLLSKILTWTPVSAVMADDLRRDLFLSWCDGLVEWTIEQLYPTWSRKPGEKSFEVDSTELYEWRRELYQFLARVSLHLDPKESFRRFVEPAANTDDDTFGSLADSYVSSLACNIMDESVLPSAPLALLELIVPRLLSHRNWMQYEWNSGPLSDRELSRMVRAMFFVNVEKALGAARFANGNWADISRILPLVETLLAAQGQNPTVTSAFLTLCERAFDSYPMDRFVVQLPMVLSHYDGMPLGWRGTSLPARLAGLIQRFSEKAHPMDAEMACALLRALDALVDMGDRRAAAIQTSEVFRDIRMPGPTA